MSDFDYKTTVDPNTGTKFTTNIPDGQLIPGTERPVSLLEWLASWVVWIKPPWLQFGKPYFKSYGGEPNQQKMIDGQTGHQEVGIADPTFPNPGLMTIPDEFGDNL